MVLSLGMPSSFYWVVDITKYWWGSTWCYIITPEKAQPFFCLADKWGLITLIQWGTELSWGWVSFFIGLCLPVICPCYWSVVTQGLPAESVVCSFPISPGKTWTSNSRFLILLKLPKSPLCFSEAFFLAF